MSWSNITMMRGTCIFFFFKQKTAYEITRRDWSSDVCSSDLMGQYSKPHTKAWAAKIGSFDAYVFVTPEYNHGISGALKNAIDFLFAEWNNKAAGFVSYGGASGARAVEQLRLVLAEVQMATVRLQVLLSLYTDFENFSVFKPDPRKETSVNDMLDQLIAWGGALKTLRKKTE